MMLNKRFINLCGQSIQFIWKSVLCRMGSLLSNIAILYIFGVLLDKLLANQQLDLLPILIYLAALILIRMVFNIAAGQFAGKSASEAKMLLRDQLYEKIVALQGNFGNTSSTMGVLQSANEGIETLENYFGRYLPQFYYALITPLLLFIILSFVSIKTALVFILTVPLIPISIMAFMRIAKRIMKNYWGSYIDLGSTFLENLRGLTTLKLFQVEDLAHNEMDEEAESFRKATMRLLTMQLNSITIMDVIAYGGSAAGIIVGLLEYQNQAISIGMFLFIILISSEFFIPLRLLGSYFHIAMTSVTAAEHIFSVLDMQEPPQGEKQLQAFESLQLENVSFSYGDNPTLSNINLHIKSGEFIALVGESGSGKSTIASLIMNLLRPNTGKILFNGIDTKEYAASSLFDHITLITTNSPVFNETIEQNLRIAKPNAGADEIKHALQQADLWETVRSLPEGLQTKVGEKGNQLSGGQRQRLAIARALLSERTVFIFDEATSNIDSDSEESIWHLINSLKGKKTILTISHRLANIKQADRIYVLDHGTIQASGTHQQLMQQQGMYSNLVFQQQALERVRG